MRKLDCGLTVGVPLNMDGLDLSTMGDRGIYESSLSDVSGSN